MSVRDDQRARRPWVRNLREQGVIRNRGEVMLVVSPKKQSLSAFRVAMRLLGMCGVLLAAYIAWLHPGAGAWQFENKESILEAVAVVSMQAYLKYAGPGALVLCLYAAVKDGLLSALGVLVLLFPAGLIIGLALGGVLLRAMGNL